MTKERICEFCGEPFVPNSNFQRYCKRPHYMNCPICGKQYLVTNNENLRRPPVACSYECRAKKTRQTSLQKYGVAAPGNNPEARVKAKASMQKKYGVDYAMQSEELKEKAKDVLIQRYGVDNIQKLQSANKQTCETRETKWCETVHQLLPLKMQEKEPCPHFNIEDDSLIVFQLTEQASVEFLSKYGFQIAPVFGKFHMSLGTVKDGILYQVLRFERRSGNIVLTNFGTREGYHNTTEYAKLLNVAINKYDIESFVSYIPRSTATSNIVDSLQLKKASQGNYEVYWVTPKGLVKLNRRHNIQEMLEKYDYVTTDYIDCYTFNS